MDNDLFVLVFENDQPFKHIDGSEWRDENGPIIMETYTKFATKDGVDDLKNRFGNRYGKCRIAKLVFMDEGEN